MAGKRKSSTEDTTGREKKKQMTALARTIAVQPASGPSQNAVAGPSRAVHFEAAKSISGSLDVEKFAEARAFEINAMHKAMETARADTTHRAWQQLPRHLRRRAASHDVRRVPLRLRDKAKAEMDTPKPKKRAQNSRHGKAGTANSGTRTQRLQKRQINKRWLESHIWHAKRMHMDDMWGYRLAVSPTEKSFRPSHRASVHGSILHDASYLSLIELKGPESVLRTILNGCCDCQDPSPAAKRFLNGARACDTHIYKRNSYPLNLIAPARILWRAGPLASPGAKQHREEPANTSKRKEKGKEKAKDGMTHDFGDACTVWIWLHPTVYNEVSLELRRSIASTLESVKGRELCEEPCATVEIADLRDHVNVFEIMGPKASQVIRGALNPVTEDNRQEFNKCWEALSELQTTASVPRNTVIGFKVHDPRLTYPPHNAKVSIDTAALPSLSSSTMSFYPTSALAQSQIWDEKILQPLKKPKFKKSDIDARRAKNLIPGAPLQAQREDDRIPCLMIQRSVENVSSPTPHSDLSGTPSVHGWTLITPAGWSMAFLSSLIHTGTRVGGQRERQTQFFESSTPFFPRDYPSTFAYDEYADERAEQEEERWSKKPSAKRPGWERLGVRSPWKPDWEVVLGLQEPQPFREDRKRNVEEELITTMREGAVSAEDMQEAVHASGAPEAMEEDRDEPSADKGGQQMEVDMKKHTLKPWLLRGQGVSNLILSLTSPSISPTHRSETLFEYMNCLRTKRGLSPLPTQPTDEMDVHATSNDLYRTALVRVAVRVCGRGCPSDMAIIYRMDDEELATFNRRRASRKGAQVLAGNMDEELEQFIVIPPQESIIGYVTTGSYSLSLGEGSAIGSIPLVHVVGLLDQGRRLGVPEMIVKVRDRHEVLCREARLLIIED